MTDKDNLEYIKDTYSAIKGLYPELYRIYSDNRCKTDNSVYSKLSQSNLSSQVLDCVELSETEEERQWAFFCSDLFGFIQGCVYMNGLQTELRKEVE